MQKYVMIVRDKIYLSNPVTDMILKAYGCYYKSPTFLWDGSLSSANAIIDKYRERFGHMYDWSATFIPVQ